MRAVVTYLLATGVLPKSPTVLPDWEQEGLSREAFDNICNTDRGMDETPIQEELQNLTTESSLAPIIVPVATRKGKQMMLQSGQSSTRQKWRPPPPTAPPGEIPPPTPPVTPLPRTRTRKQKDQDTSDSMFPTQVTITSADTALRQGKHRAPYPTIVQRTAGLLRKPQERMKQQREDYHLLGKIQDLDNEGTGGEYVADGDGLLWYPPPGSILRLTIPHSLIPGILALVHTTYGHPGVARTTELIQRTIGHHSRATSETTCFLADAECLRDPSASVSPCYRLACSSPGKSWKWTSITWEQGRKPGTNTSWLQ